MPRSVRLTDEAKRNLREISSHIAQDSAAYAKRWSDGLRRDLKSLARFSERHELVYSRAEVGRDIRQTFFGVYRILYTVEGDTVFVLTVRHGARKPIGPGEIEVID